MCPLTSRAGLRRWSWAAWLVASVGALQVSAAIARAQTARPPAPSAAPPAAPTQPSTLSDASVATAPAGTAVPATNGPAPEPPKSAAPVASGAPAAAPGEPGAVSASGETVGAAMPNAPPATGETAPLPAPGPPPVQPSTLATVLADAATDLGLELERPPSVHLATPDCASSEDPAVPGLGKVSIAGVLELQAEQWWLRVAVTRDDATTHSTRVELSESNFEVQTIRALALTVKTTAGTSTPNAEKTQTPAAQTRLDTSEGKATLATTGAALGGYFGFALESAGGDIDTRLVYPLVALGAGVGLASALIVAEEWPLTRPQAWYISGGGIWLTVAGVLIASEQDLKHRTDRYPYGLIGTAAGLGISSYVVSQRSVSEAEAVFSQSGALFGAIAGGFVQELVDPTQGRFPRLGIGVGAGGGWLLASLGTARLMPGLSSSRVLFADLGGFLGALVGAAAASPAVVNQGPPQAGDRRAFVGASLGGLVLGSVVGYWLGSSAEVPDSARLPVRVQAATLASTPGATPFDPGLPAATALTLGGQW